MNKASFNKHLTIEGTTFLCLGCHHRFIAGPKGLEAVRGRVQDHYLTIEGTTFLCLGCHHRFIAGPKGLEAVRDRVQAHFAGNKEASTAEMMEHRAFTPINPKPGMFYVSTKDNTDRIGPVYKEGKDPNEWFAEVTTKATEFGIDVEPSWDLDNENI